MKTLLFGLLLIPSIALAHPADQKTDKKHSTEGQYPYAHLGLDDDVVFESHRIYWHHRRALAAKIREYNLCRGKIHAFYSLLGWSNPDSQVDMNTVEYWDVIPAHPCADEGYRTPKKQVAWCDANTEAAIYQINIIDVQIYECNALANYLEWLIRAWWVH